jgi:uncharacterized membrane protein YfcA
MDILGYFFALLIGVSLGIIGGGGSILSVPVLVYLFQFNEKIATAYSLFVVGIGALIGGIQKHFQKNVNWKIAIIFGIPSIAGVWIVRHYIVPFLPDILFSIGSLEISRRMFTLGLFAILMFPAAWSMLKKEISTISTRENVNYNYALILSEGLLVGSITGFVGAGGGFLIIPALVVLAKLDMKMAVGTSLIIIAIKSLLGFFLGDALTMQVDWGFLSIFSSFTLIGIFIGSYLGKFINGAKLKKGFGYFIIFMALFIFYMEFFTK